MLVTVAALAARPVTTSAQALTPIVVGSAHGWTLDEGYIAAAKGFFTAAGLDAKIRFTRKPGRQLRLGGYAVRCCRPIKAR
jgi:hypothetical protein